MKSSLKLTQSKDLKLQLEEEKLRLEIAELKRPWFKKPAFLIPFIGAISSIIVLWSTGFFSTKMESLNTSIEKLKIEKGKLDDVKNLLVQDSIRLDGQKRQLLSDSSVLRQSIAKLSRDTILLHKRVETISDSLKLASKPLLQIGKVTLFSTKKVGIYVTNEGTGTAYIKMVNFYYKGKKYAGTNEGNFFKPILQDLGIDHVWVRFEGKKLGTSIYTAGSLKSGESYMTLGMEPQYFDVYNMIEFLKAVAHLTIEIKYFSITGQEYVCREEIKEDQLAK